MGLLTRMEKVNASALGLRTKRRLSAVGGPSLTLKHGGDFDDKATGLAGGLGGATSGIFPPPPAAVEGGSGHPTRQRRQFACTRYGIDNGVDSLASSMALRHLSSAPNARLTSL